MVSATTGKLVTAFYRVSKRYVTPSLDVLLEPLVIHITTSRVSCLLSAWLSDKLNDTVATISRRISAMTGLSLETAEHMQV